MSDLPISTLGRTGLEVTKLGYGAMEVRGTQAWNGPDVDDEHAATILNAVLDSGINFIDTSPDYGLSEERIGASIAGRRDEFFLATKCGCPVLEPGDHVFTRENIRACVEQSLRRMRTEHLDVVQFHASPSRAVLEAEDSITELLEQRDAGKVRFIGMSGVLPNLTDHIAMGVFDVFQIPYSAVEPQHEQSISDAAEAGAGTVIRGGVARGIPAVPEDVVESLPEGLQERRDLFEKAELDELLDGTSRMEFLLRFTLSHPGMHTTIVGTANLDHHAANVAAASKGILPADVYEEAKRRLSVAAAG